MKFLKRPEIMKMLKEVKKQINEGVEIQDIVLEGFEYVGDNILDSAYRYDGKVKKGVEGYTGEKIKNIIYLEGLQIELYEGDIRELQAHIKYKADTEYNTFDGWYSVVSLNID